MKKIIKYLQTIGSLLLAIIIIAIIILPYILLIFYLRSKGQTIEIYPKFKIKNIERNTNINEGILNSAVNHAEEILKKIKSNK